MSLSDRSQLLQGHVSDAFSDENLSRRHQIERFFEGNLDVVFWLCLTAFVCFGQGERDVFFEIAPFVTIFDCLVIQTEVGDDDVFYLGRISSLESEVEQPALLSQEPLPQLVVPTVRESANEMGNVVV